MIFGDFLMNYNSVNIGSAKDINKWREEYLSVLKGWNEHHNEVKEHYRGLTTKSWEGARYVLRNLPFTQEQLIFCPPYSILNMAPCQQHRIDYGTGSFEGSSAEPYLNSAGEVVGINIILHKPRMQRLLRSLQNRSYVLPMAPERFAQAILDAVAVHGKSIVVAENHTASRAYIRPSIGPGVGPLGVSFKEGHFIETSVLVYRWGDYFQDAERIRDHGARVVITGVKRMFPITGKHASNYGSAAAEGSIARKLSYDELIYLAPYGIKNNILDYGIVDFDELMRWGVVSDGPAEEIFALLSDGETLIYPPKRVNRLGGTVLNYIVEFMAPKMGLRVIEKDITLQDIREGRIVGLAFAGNAVKITPIGSVDIVKSSQCGIAEEITTLADFGGIHPTIIKLRNQFAAELCGKTEPSHASLLTPVDLEWGKNFKIQLDEYWGKLGFV
jgi:branched-subunit amino acid aminotransferase/4-amino-4-deoxychorismate lyase